MGLHYKSSNTRNIPLINISLLLDTQLNYSCLVNLTLDYGFVDCLIAKESCNQFLYPHFKVAKD